MQTPDAFQKVLDELKRVQGRFAPMHSPHEGIAVVEEEFLELRDAVFSAKWDGTGGPDQDHITTEAIQLAAMSIRFLIDVCPDGSRGT